MPLPLSIGFLEKGAEPQTITTVLDDGLRCFINSVITLAFVPPIFIRVAWRCLEGDASVFGNKDDIFLYCPDHMD